MLPQVRSRGNWRAVPLWCTGIVPKKSVSMADVARLAGVAPQTVSRVSNGHPGVVDSTRARVLAAMEELQYRPNHAARALKRGSFRSLAVVLSGRASSGSFRTLQAMVDAAAELEYSVTVMALETPSADSLREVFTRMAAAAIDGAVLVMEIDSAAGIHLSRLPQGRLVVVDASARDRYPSVDSDHVAGVNAVMEHLLGLGHETVHHVTGPSDSYSSNVRVDAWRRCLQAAGRVVPAPLAGDWSAESGYRAGLRITQDAAATAVFVSNDEMALGLMRALGEHGIRVPHDISVVGFDDIALAPQFPTPLTTVHQDFDELGRRCVHLLVRQLEGDDVAPHVSLVPTRLVVRASSGTPRADAGHVSPRR